MEADEKSYLEYIGTLLDTAGSRKSDIVCLPEDFAELGDKPQSIDGCVGKFIIPYAKKHNTYIIMPINEQYKGKVYNSAVVIDRDSKVMGRYFKVHPVPGEIEKFKTTKGDTLPVFKTDFGTIGIMTCFDVCFPEVPAILARKGAQAIFLPHQLNSPDPDTYMLNIRAQAMFNSVYLVASTWGTAPGAHWNPQSCYPSCIIGQDGKIIACSQGEAGVITATIDIQRKWMVQGHGEPELTDMRDIFEKYRRPDIYRKEDPEQKT